MSEPTGRHSTVEDCWDVAGTRRLETWDGWPHGPKVFARRHGPFARFVIEARLIRVIGTTRSFAGLVGPRSSGASGRLVLSPPDLAVSTSDVLPVDSWPGLSALAPDVAIEGLGPADETSIGTRRASSKRSPASSGSSVPGNGR